MGSIGSCNLSGGAFWRRESRPSQCNQGDYFSIMPTREPAEMEAYRDSRAVNTLRNNQPRLLEQVA